MSRFSILQYVLFVIVWTWIKLTKTKIWTNNAGFIIKIVNDYYLSLHPMKRIKILGICYLVLEQKLKWSEARDTCRREENGADLTSINSEQELNFIQSMFYFMCSYCSIFDSGLFQNIWCFPPRNNIPPPPPFFLMIRKGSFF